jgi:anti-anti-sigma factor
MKKYLNVREFDKIIIVDIKENLIEDDQDDLLLATLAEVAERKKNVGVNLKTIRYLDSRIINVLQIALKKIHHHSKELYMVEPTESVKRLFYANNLDCVFSIVSNEKDLIDQLEEGAP